MDYSEVLKKLEALRCLVEKCRDTSNGLTPAEHAELAMLYGECEPIITQILGIQNISVPGRRSSVEIYRNMIEAGYLSSRTIHRYAGHQQLLKVIGHVRHLANDPVVNREELDVLLPLHSRRIFDDQLRQLLAEGVDADSPVSLVMIDIDHFKSVNDMHGHPVGDEVLKSIATVLLRVLGRKGNAYRYGGEEIVILLPNTTSEEATAFAERLRRGIESSLHGSKQLRITASFGIATAPEHTNETSELVKLADCAMYEAKQLGRNYVRVAGEPKPEAIQPRKVERKQPPANGMMDDQKDAIRLQYFRSGQADCPNDGALLRVQQSHQFGRPTPDLFILCPVCGLNAKLPGK